MSSKSPVIVPSKEAPFREMWQELLRVPNAFIPYISMRDSGIPADRGGPMLLESDDIEQIVSRLAWKNGEGLRFGVIATDRALIGEHYVYIERPMVQVLERYFHSAKQVGGVLFNSHGPHSPADFTPPYPWFAKRFFLPRLIGMLQSKDPWAERGGQHVEMAKAAVSEDQIYLAFHHACMAREQSDPLDSVAFAEMDALFYLSLHQELHSYFNWYRSNGGAGDSTQLCMARLMCSLGKQYDEAAPILEQYLSHPTLKCWANLESGRRHMLMSAPEQALPYFNKCVELDSSCWDGWLGRGLALRALHYQSGDKLGLNEARECFERVAALKGYHAPEALHHCGTIRERLEQYEQAVEKYEATLALRESAVSRMNLVRCLAALGKLEDARHHHAILEEYDPQRAAMATEALRKQDVAVSSPQSALDWSHVSSMSALQQQEFLNQEALRASQLAHSWSLPLQGDIMDFKRIDEYISHHAPSGVFLESCAFHGMGPEDLSQVLFTIAMHLSGVLVRRGHGRWVADPSGNPLGTSVAFKDTATFSEPLCWYSVVAHRLAAGASADNVTNLSMLVSLLPEYGKLSKTYQSAIKHTPCTDAQRSQFKQQAQAARDKAKALGFALEGDSADLKKLDALIEHVFAAQIPSPEVERVIGEEARLFAVGLGLHLGEIFEFYTEGSWISHPSVAGVSLQTPYLNTYFPIQALFRRIDLAGQSSPLTDLSSMESPLVIALMARKLKNHEVKTREELKKLLSSALPGVMKEDPTGASLDRIATMTCATAGVMV